MRAGQQRGCYNLRKNKLQLGTTGTQQLARPAGSGGALLDCALFAGGSTVDYGSGAMRELEGARSTCNLGWHTTDTQATWGVLKTDGQHHPPTLQTFEKSWDISHLLDEVHLCLVRCLAEEDLLWLLLGVEKCGEGGVWESGGKKREPEQTRVPTKINAQTKRSFDPSESFTK